MKNNEKILDRKSNQTLAVGLDRKINGLKRLKEALHDHNDLLIYQLLDPQRYYQVVEPQRTNESQEGLLKLTSNLTAQLGHYLSDRLIDYLGKAFPFFYYHEYELGHFVIYFGNWWDHRKFGKLDAIQIRFIFNHTEFNKLKNSFKSAAKHQRFNADKVSQIKKQISTLRSLIASQSERDNLKLQLREALQDNRSKSRLPWEAQKLNTARKKIMARLNQLAEHDKQAVQAKPLIQDARHQILNLSKEDAILGYERQGIRENFEDFKQFVRTSQHLYRDYILNLVKNNKVNKHAK